MATDSAEPRSATRILSRLPFVGDEQVGGGQRGAPGTRRLAWPLLAPALLVVMAVVAVPIVRVFWLSVHDVDLAGTQQQFVGLDNFREAVSSSTLRQAMWVTGVYTVASVGIAFLFGLSLALVLERLPKRWKWLQGVFVAPWATSAVVVAFIFLYMFDVQVGVINEIMVRLGILQSYMSWLSDSTLAFAAVTVATVWQMTPFFMLMFIAGLKGIPRQIIDAAKVDGASGFNIFRYISLPYLRGIMIIAVTLMGIRVLNNFPIIWTMTQGGPVRATTTVVIEVYRRAFQQFDIGSAAAVSVIWLLIVLFFAAFYVRRVLTSERM